MDIKSLALLERAIQPGSALAIIVDEEECEDERLAKELAKDGCLEKVRLTVDAYRLTARGQAAYREALRERLSALEGSA
jgi:hypothetical protein